MPANVGAAARAMKTMGFSQLRLIQACDHLAPEARLLAHASHDILEKARVFTDLHEASRDLDLVICTTAKGRTAKFEYHSSRDILSLLKKKESELQKVGFLFGSEESGLPNELVLKSDLAMSIPMATGYPSLNLAQAVMVVAYELSPLNVLSKPGKQLHKSREGWSRLKNQATRLLLDSGIPEESPLFNRIMERLATIKAEDIPLFLSVLSRISRTD